MFRDIPENIKLKKSFIQYSPEVGRYYCIKRVVDDSLARDNYSGDSKSLGLINYPIIFKTEREAMIYLLSKEKLTKLPLYVVDMVYKYHKGESSSYILGEYPDIDE